MPCGGCAERRKARAAEREKKLAEKAAAREAAAKQQSLRASAQGK